MHDVSIQLKGLRLKLYATGSGTKLDLTISRAQAQVLAAGLRASAGAINKDDSHLAPLSNMCFATEISQEKRTQVVRVGGGGRTATGAIKLR